MFTMYSGIHRNADIDADHFRVDVPAFRYEQCDRCSSQEG
jgi:hypothetical protein